MQKISFFVILIMSTLSLSAQKTYTISGKITDKQTNRIIEHATISLLDANLGVISDSTGYYQLCHLPAKRYTLLVNNLGYKNDTVQVLLDRDVTVNIELISKDIALRDIVIPARIMQVRSEIWDKPADSFAKLLNIFPGATKISMGAGIAKPVVRGLSFNRVAVVNRGIVQQNQQWGADHGMEVSQFDMEHAMVYKGPNSLLLGSGTTTVIDIEPFKFKSKDFFAGEAVLWGESNNDQLGSALTIQQQKGKWYTRGAFSYQDYADYRVPASTFDHDGEEVEIHNKRLANTAGKEFSASGTIGFREKNVTSYINVSNNYKKNGLFEGGHDHGGHEHEEGEEHHDEEESVIDNSHRNIGLPYSTSNHFTVTNNTEWKTASKRLVVNTGYQNNHRREYEHFHELYEGQPSPLVDDDIAVDFKLQTYSTNARLYLDEDKKWKKTIGISGEYQQNRVHGFEFFLPRYNQLSGGLSFVNSYDLSDKVRFEAGLRYDIGHMDITGYYDDGLAEHLADEGYAPSVVDKYAQRAYVVDRNFGSWSGSAGLRYRPISDLTLKLNLGKSFRFPSANELASNGLHHAAFRYEIGSPNLKPEHGYTFDIDAHYASNDVLGLDGSRHLLTVNFSPFVNYYTNFIYLQPLVNPEIDLYGEHPYRYSQAKAVYGGGEYNIFWRMIENLEVSSGGSIVLNKNIDDKKPLPFTPPFMMKNEVRFLNHTNHKTIKYYQFTLSHQLYARQTRVGVGEEETAGANLFHIGGGFDYQFSKQCTVRFNLQVQNIFDTRYLNHMSLYRKLNIPEQGRNVQIFIRIPFGS